MAIIRENNGDAADAPADTSYSIALGDVFQGTLSPTDVIDLVQVELSADTIYDFSLSSTETLLISLIDSTGDQVAGGVLNSSGARIIISPPAGGTYYIRIYNPADDFSGEYEISLVENTIPVGTYDDIAAYLTDGFWDGYRYAFDVGPGGVLTADITDLSEENQQLASWALQAWTNVTGIRFELVEEGDADITFYRQEDGTSSAGFVTDNSGTIISGHVNFSTDDSSHGIVRSLNVLIHEIGHALGLGHPGPYPRDYENPYADFGVDNVFLLDSAQASVMSYIYQTRNTYIDASLAIPLTPMIADIIAIQDLYGVPAGINAGDTIYGYESGLDGYLGQVFSLLTGDTETSTTHDLALTLYDSGGEDTLDLRNDTVDQRVYLRPEGISDVYGLTGNLVIARDTVIENFIAGSGNDIIVGNAAANYLQGNDGNDGFWASSGDDILEGGAGADRLNGDAGMDLVSYRGSDAAVNVNLADATVSGGHADGDVITGIEGAIGSDHDDVLQGDDAANRFEGGPGADRLDGGAGIDWLSYQGSDAGVTVNLADDTVSGGHAEGDTIAGFENVTGSAFQDVLTGNGDDNRLVGGDGDDNLQGNADNDVLEGSAGADTLDGGTGTDWATYAGSDTGVSVNLKDGTAEKGHAEGDTFTGIENLGGSPYGDILAGDDNVNVLEGGDGDDELQGNAGNDVLKGGPGADRLDGGDDNDELSGDEGDDILSGGAGADSLDGGIGWDRASYAGSGAGITVDLSDGAGEGGHAQGDVITGIEHLVGSAYADVLVGDDAANLLEGEDGNDELRGNGGDDVLKGGAGADELDGGDDDDELSGNEGDDILKGGAGSDRLDGGAGADDLDGGDDDDELSGNEGDDILKGSAGDDRLNGGAGADQLDGGSGIDWIIYRESDAGVTIDLTDNSSEGGYAEGDTISNVENIVGTDYADVLTGDGNANTLHGLDGADELSGNGGNDVLNGGAGADRLDGGSGTDRVSYQGSDAGVTVSLANGTSEGGHAQGDVLTGIESVTGSDYQDELTGDDNANDLAGGDGNDALQGRGGADRLDGGGGTDWIRYWASDTGVTVNLEEGAGEGGDAEGDVIAHVENVMGSRHGDVLIGNSDNNYLDGLGGDDDLRGNDGNDWLDGRAGADKLDGGDGADWVSYWASDAGVTVNLGEDTTAGGHAEGDEIDNVENIRGSDHADVLTGDGNANRLRGFDGDDELRGKDGDDYLGGGSGADLLEGGGGADRLFGNSGSLGDESTDTFVFAAGHGDDIIYDFANNEDKIDLSAFDLAGFDDLTITSTSYSVTIDLTDHGGGTIQLYDFDIANLDATDFLF